MRSGGGRWWCVSYLRGSPQPEVTAARKVKCVSLGRHKLQKVRTRARLGAAWGESKLHASYLKRLALRREILGEGVLRFTDEFWVCPNSMRLHASYLRHQLFLF